MPELLSLALASEFGLKGNQSGILEQAQALLAQQGFPPQGQWEKGQGSWTIGAWPAWR
jgi:hypothetical protein